MRIHLLVPPEVADNNGNGVTSERWKAFMEELGHEVTVSRDICSKPCDLLVAFHASRTRGAVMNAKQKGVASRIVICFTGTDLYRDLREDPSAFDVAGLADRLVVLQPAALDELPVAFREKTSVIYQSASSPGASRAQSPDAFDVCVIAHLRDVKDPLRAALAARLLPPESRVRVTLVGRALTEEFGQAAQAEAENNGRFRWLGELSRAGAARVLTQSRLLVLSSLMEGGANVISEAVVADVPVVVTEISCMKGLLGEDYPGFFPVGDTEVLAGLLLRAETDPSFYDALKERCRQVAHKFSPAMERERIRELIEAVPI
jgi:putative glycosyltransferase (TIGR04348 family)